MDQALQQTLQELLFAFDATIDGWMRALALKDKETEGHSYRVTELALTVARQVGIPNADLLHLRRGALLHDIGKIGIPDDILQKPGPLSSEEWKLMRQHPEFGFQILGSISLLEPAAEIVYCHHENWDGSGYPRGLKGEATPLMARMVSVCNVYDGLVFDTPYRAAWHRVAALEYIQDGSGKQFDPHIVAAFTRVIRNEP